MPAGAVRQIARYPVKSMRGETLSAANLTLQGLEEDRRYAFVQTASRSSFPWLTARELPEMLRFHTAVANAGRPEVSVTVTTLVGASWPVDSTHLRGDLEERSGRP